MVTRQDRVPSDAKVGPCTKGAGKLRQHEKGKGALTAIAAASTAAGRRRQPPARTAAASTMRKRLEGRTEARATEPTKDGHRDVQSGPQQEEQRHTGVTAPGGAWQREEGRQYEHRIRAKVDENLPDQGGRFVGRHHVDLELAASIDVQEGAGELEAAREERPRGFRKPQPQRLCGRNNSRRAVGRRLRVDVDAAVAVDERHLPERLRQRNAVRHRHDREAADESRGL